jgi:predicted ATPase/serine phosphatase RsbU (regulator of sigma subunit)
MISAYDGYEIKERLNNGSDIEVFRAIDKNNIPTIIKSIPIHNEFHPSVINLKNEFDVLKLLESEVILKAYSFQRYQNGYYLAYEDIGGVSLKEYSKNQKIPLESFFQIAYALTDILTEIHKRRIIHKDIKPENIIINPKTMNVKIIDFGISSKLSREESKWNEPNVLQGSIQYISPEQTGRMNRSVDYRSDFYSLGVTFYQMLTGKLPFESKDLLELVHAHLAKTPSSVHEVDSSIPISLSQIVEKLMAKTAENRYQTAKGLRYDLELAQKASTNEKINLGTKDLSNEFKIPQKLYGRGNDILNLIEEFAEVHEKGTSKLILISGYSGVGKSSLVKEINKPITASKGYFISGKYDQYNRNLPFSAIIQVFTNLIRLFLTESPESIELWKKKILQAVGSNGKVITDVIPELEIIIGEQPPVAELGPQENSNRFYLVFQNFIKIFANFEHPLAIFLDDLQWADSASLTLIQNLMEDDSVRYLFIMLAYRDNEVEVSHPFNLMIAELKKKEIIPSVINLVPLAVNHVNELLRDCLFASEEDVSSFAEMVHQKTGGNPFFITELLKQLSKEDSIYFNYDKGKWNWDLGKIKSTKISENVVELLIGRIQKLSDKTQNILKLASCIGNHFDLATLSLINMGAHPQDTANDLEETIKEELIYPIGDNYRLVDSMGREIKDAKRNYDTAKKINYKFQHDRVQQASYELIGDEEKKKLRLKIGRILVKSVDKEENLFDIANHLNIGSELVTEDLEKIQIIEINLQAGKKAKISTAYKPALEYLLHAERIIKTIPNFWTEHYDLTLSVYKELAEVEYLNGNFSNSESLTHHILDMAKTDLEKGEAYNMLMVQYTVEGKFDKALPTVIKALKPLGLNLPSENYQAIIAEEQEEVKKNLNGRKIPDLIQEPQMQNPTMEMAVKLLMNTITTTYNIAIELFPIVCLKMVNIFLKHGNLPESYGYSAYGIMLAGGGDYKNAYEYSLLSINVSQKFGSKAGIAKAANILANYANPWNHHLKLSDKINRDGIQAALDSGEFMHGGYSALHIMVNSFYTGKSILSMFEDLPRMLEFSNRAKNVMAIDTILGVEIIISNLNAKTSNTSIFQSDSFDEKSYLELCNEHQSMYPVTIYKIMKCQLLFLYDSKEEMLSLAEETKGMLAYISGINSVAEFNFYRSLILLTAYKEASKETRIKYLEEVKSNQKQMKIWAESCSENFLHKYLLVEAEIARIEYKNWKAGKLYDEAIFESRKNEFVQNEALANELAAKFWIKKKNLRFAQNYLLEAYRCYESWGAVRKCEDLKSKYPNFITDQKIPFDFSKTISGTLTISSSTGNAANGTTQLHVANTLDLQSVLKSSSAISGEIKIESLLNKIMSIVIENAGAQRGILLLKKDKKLFIEAEGSINSESTKVMTNIPIEEYSELPSSVIYYVDRTKENKVLSNASADEKFNKDAYIIRSQTKSILCSPILKQGELTGILYLENNLSEGAFTADRLQVVNVLSSQAAISIDNALLYANMEQKVKDRTKELAETNDKLAEKNQHITDSINYAKTIQEAILPSKSIISKDLSDFFIIFRPKDIVSGDFYWYASVEEYTFIAAVDCTGHGVPGAFMSMIGSSILNQIVKELKIYDPAIILEHLNKNVRHALRQDVKEDASRDGMEIALCRISKKDKKTIFAGGHRPLYMVKGNEFITIKGDKESIGGKQKEERKYTNQEIVIEEGVRTVLYLTTDGFQDQPNIDGKKIGSRGLQESILQHYTKSGLEQKDLFQDALDRHTNYNQEPQRDDITVIGIIL